MLNGIHSSKSNQVPQESKWLCTQKYGDYDPSALFYITEMIAAQDSVFFSLG